MHRLHEGFLRLRHGPRRRRNFAVGLFLAAGAGAVIALLVVTRARPSVSGCSKSPTITTASTPSPPAREAGASPSSATGSASTWRLAFTSDFTGSSLDTALWTSCYPWFRNQHGCTNFGNDELEWYRSSQVRVSGHELRLTAQEKPTPGLTSSAKPATYSWRSGMVTTFHGCAFTYGFVRVVAKIPKGDGFWPALWLLPIGHSWPPEIDMMENYGVQPRADQMTFHQTKTIAPARTLVSRTDLGDAFHTYSIDWEPHSITWYFDGSEVFRVTQDVPHQPMYFLADLAVDGQSGVTTSSTTPSTASFDLKSVQIWQR